MTFTFDIEAFRVSYPEFADETKYPDDLLQRNWDFATCYISDTDYGWLNGDCRYNALTLMTAHLTKLGDVAAAGKVPSLKQSSTIDKISVSHTPPPLKSQWGWWLSLTAYGQQLFALLQVKAVGGLFVGGSRERSAFRKAGGCF